MATCRVPIQQVERMAGRLASRIHEHGGGVRGYHLIAIPRGGVPVAYVLAEQLRLQGDNVELSLPSDHVRSLLQTLVVDDIVVTGETIKRILSTGEAARGVALYAKSECPPEILIDSIVSMDTWVRFPWEESDADLGKPEDAVRRLLEYVGDDPTREGLRETPARVLRFLDEIREQALADVVATTFETKVEDLIVTARIPFASLCEHHALPYWGEASVGYIPHGKLLGLSKSARAVQIAASGLSIQEHLTHKAAVAISEWAGSPDVAVLTTASHSCMIVRGVKAVGSRTAASAMLGKFRDSAPLRAEFFAVIDEARSLA